MTQCCERCQYWGNCDIKWYRGERGEEQLCCNRCGSYDECNPRPKTKSSVKKSKKKRR